MHRNMIVDLNNIIFTTRFAKVKTPSGRQRKEQYVTELIFKEAITAIVNKALELKADAIVVARDSPNVWRKDIHPDYKGNREHNDVYYQETIDAAELCTDFFKTCTNVAVVEAPRAEADDVIAVFCQESEGVENVILSSDKDFVQLLDERTQLFSPPQNVFRESEDVAYDLFLKCVRGDTNDNIKSAFPRVRETRLRKAWDDELEMVNLLETVRKDNQKVGDVLEFNRKLICLDSQPEDIRTSILNAIQSARGNRFGELRIMRYFAEHNLKDHADILAYKERPLKGHFVFKAK